MQGAHSQCNQKALPRAWLKCRDELGSDCTVCCVKVTVIIKRRKKTNGWITILRTTRVCRAGHWTEKKEFTCSLVHKLLKNCVFTCSLVHTFLKNCVFTCSLVHWLLKNRSSLVHLWTDFRKTRVHCSLVHTFPKNCVFTCSFVRTFLMNRSSLVHLFEQFELLICSKVLKKVFCRVFCFPS